MGITRSEIVFLTFGIQHATRMPHVVIRGLPVQQYFSYYLINGTIKKKLLNTKCVF
jgi:hypothetical protein